MAFIPAIMAAGSAAISAMGGMSTIATVAGLGSSLLGAVGTLQQGAATASAANYNAKVAEIQAKNAENQAAAKYGELSRRGKLRAAEASAAAVESGFDLSGSFRDFLSQSLAFGELDALGAIYEGGVRASGSRAEASQYRAEAKNAKTASYIGAGTKLLGGVASVYGPGGSSSFGKSSVF